MNYTQRLNHIASLDEHDALETILNEAANATQDETLSKLFSGALIDMVDTRGYGDKAMSQVASMMSLRKQTAYERRNIIRFYGQYSACADFLDHHPAIRYSHFRDAMRLGKFYHSDDKSRSRQTAMKAMRWAADNDMRIYQFSQWVSGKTAPNKPNRVGHYTGIITAIDENMAVIQITGGDMKTLHDYAEDVLRLNISVESEEGE